MFQKLLQKWDNGVPFEAYEFRLFDPSILPHVSLRANIRAFGWRWGIKAYYTSLSPLLNLILNFRYRTWSLGLIDPETDKPMDALQEAATWRRLGEM